jgi:hypothetical protein
MTKKFHENPQKSGSENYEPMAVERAPQQLVV